MSASRSPSPVTTPALPGRDISVRAVTWISLVVFLVLTLPQISPAFYQRYFGGDFGIVHFMEAVLLASGVGVSAWLVVRPGIDWPKGARWYALFICIGIFVLLGEDFEWGQDIFRWETSGWFAQYNDENETNFHNTSVWLDQHPRALLNLGMFLGAILHPLLLRYRGKGIFDKWPAWFVPTLASTPPAVFSFVVWIPKLIDKSDILGDIKLQVGRASERQEVFIYMFMLVYMLSLSARLSRPKPATAPD